MHFASGKIGCFLLQNFDENQNGQNNANQGVQADQRADQAENNADQRNLSQQADDDTANNVDDHINDQADDKSGQFGCLESVGEEFFEHIHNIVLLFMYWDLLMILYRSLRKMQLNFKNLLNFSRSFQQKRGDGVTLGLDGYR